MNAIKTLIDQLNSDPDTVVLGDLHDNLKSATEECERLLNLPAPKDIRYNGWTNYETWNVALWQGNDQGSYTYWQEQAQSAYDNAEPSTINTKDQAATYSLATTMKDEYEEMADSLLPENLKASVWADLIGAALSEVNWQEIAEHLIDDVDKESEVDDEKE